MNLIALRKIYFRIYSKVPLLLKKIIIKKNFIQNFSFYFSIKTNFSRALYSCVVVVASSVLDGRCAYASRRRDFNLSVYF